MTGPLQVPNVLRVTAASTPQRILIGNNAYNPSLIGFELI